MFHRQIFYIVSLTKVGNDKWKNKRKDKFFNMVVTRGIPPLETVTKNSGIHVEPASFERQQSLSSPPQTPVAALVSTRKWRKPAALSRTGNAVSMTKMRAGNSMSCLPRNLYQTKSTWYGSYSETTAGSTTITTFLERRPFTDTFTKSVSRTATSGFAVTRPLPLNVVQVSESPSQAENVASPSDNTLIWKVSPGASRAWSVATFTFCSSQSF